MSGGGGPCLPELSVDELAVIYSAAILADDDVTITVDKISTLLKAANVDVEPIWPTLYARALASLNVRQLLISTTTTGAPRPSPPTTTAPSGGAPSTPAPATAKGDEKGTEKKEEEEEDDDDEDLGMNLFDFD